MRILIIPGSEHRGPQGGKESRHRTVASDACGLCCVKWLRFSGDIGIIWLDSKPGVEVHEVGEEGRRTVGL